MSHIGWYNLGFCLVFLNVWFTIGSCCGDDTSIDRCNAYCFLLCIFFPFTKVMSSCCCCCCHSVVDLSPPCPLINICKQCLECTEICRKGDHKSFNHLTLYSQMYREAFTAFKLKCTIIYTGSVQILSGNPTDCTLNTDRACVQIMYRVVRCSHCNKVKPSVCVYFLVHETSSIRSPCIKFKLQCSVHITEWSFHFQHSVIDLEL